jgi:integrase
MGTYRKRGGKWEAAICIDGVCRSASRPTKREAVEWAAAQTVAIKSAQGGGIPDVPFSVVLERYKKDVTPHKRGSIDEAQHITRVMRDDFATICLPNLKPTRFAEWRDRRLREVMPSTVLRDRSLLSHVCTKARKEWGYLKENPLSGVERPKPSPHRDRRISETEISQILLALGYSRGRDAKNIRERVAVMFLFAIETGMRRGEMLSLSWNCVRGNVAHLSKTRAFLI